MSDSIELNRPHPEAPAPSERGTADAQGGWAGLFAAMAITFVANILLCLASLSLFTEHDLGDKIDAYVELARAIGDGEFEPLLVIGAIAGGMVILQGIFLLPVFRPPAVARRPRSLKKSVAMVSFVVAGMTAALVWAGAELISGETEFYEVSEQILPGFFFVLPSLVLVLTWILWGGYFWRLSRPFDPAAIDRLMLPLLRYSAIGMVLIVPIDALVRRRRDCYCATGSYAGLLFGAMALLWLLGPFVLIGVSRSRRLALRRHICLDCGHERRAGSGLRCQECGRGWTRRKRAQIAASESA